MLASRDSEKAPKSGDILLELLNDDVKTQLGQRTHKEMPINLLHFIASHGMIYKSESKEEASILHSSPGQFLQGVKKNNFIRKLEKSSFYAGSFVVLRLRDPKLAAEITAVAQRWTECKKIQAVAEKEPATESCIFQATPYHGCRKADAPELRDLFELYRGFRAHMRNMHEPTLPLSKDQGASCSNFVFYCLKVAIINQWFPKDVLAAIQTELLAIETIKEKEKITKLKEFKDNLEHFHKIREIVEKFAKTKLEHEAVAEFLQRERVIKVLFEPVKAEGIRSFVEVALKYGLFDVKGYLYCQEKMAPDALAIMNHETLMNLKKIHQGAVLQPIVVSAEDVLTLSTMPIAEYKKVGDKGLFRPVQQVEYIESVQGVSVTLDL